MKFIFLSLIVMTLLSCNDTNSVADESNYLGVWYYDGGLDQRSFYLDITDKDNVLYKYCTLHDGYQPQALSEQEKGISSIEEDTLIHHRQDEEDFILDLSLSFNHNQLTLSYRAELGSVTSTVNEDILTKKQTIPDYCEDDAIEVTNIFINIDESEYGSNVLIELDYEYRSSIDVEVGLCLPSTFYYIPNGCTIRTDDTHTQVSSSLNVGQASATLEYSYHLSDYSTEYKVVVVMKPQNSVDELLSGVIDIIYLSINIEQ